MYVLISKPIVFVRIPANFIFKILFGRSSERIRILNEGQYFSIIHIRKIEKKKKKSLRGYKADF